MIAILGIVRVLIAFFMYFIKCNLNIYSHHPAWLVFYEKRNEKRFIHILTPFRSNSLNRWIGADGRNANEDISIISSKGDAGVASRRVVDLHWGFAGSHLLGRLNSLLLGGLLVGLSCDLLLRFLEVRVWLVVWLDGFIPGQAEVALATGCMVYLYWSDSLVLLGEFHLYYFKSNCVHTINHANCQNWNGLMHF